MILERALNRKEFIVTYNDYLWTRRWNSINTYNVDEEYNDYLEAYRQGGDEYQVWIERECKWI